jgi:FkbM family methyltransferase
MNEIFRSLKTSINYIFGLAGLRIVRTGLPALTPADASLRQMLNGLGITIVFDVGAHIGEYATRLRALGYESQIISFEPQKSAFGVLVHSAVSDSKWTVCNFALGDRASVQTMNISQNSFSSSILPVEPEILNIELGIAQVRTETVSVQALDQLADRFVHPSDNILLKIDAQGYEPQILAGAEKFLRSCTAVQIEMALFSSYRGQKGFFEIAHLMNERGFRLVHLEPVFGDCVTGYLIEVDGVFVREDRLQGVFSTLGRVTATSG